MKKALIFVGFFLLATAVRSCAMAVAGGHCSNGQSVCRVVSFK